MNKLSKTLRNIGTTGKILAVVGGLTGLGVHVFNLRDTAHRKLCEQLNQGTPTKSKITFGIDIDPIVTDIDELREGCRKKFKIPVNRDCASASIVLSIIERFNLNIPYLDQTARSFSEKCIPTPPPIVKD